MPCFRLKLVLNDGTVDVSVSARLIKRRARDVVRLREMLNGDNKTHDEKFVTSARGWNKICVAFFWGGGLVHQENKPRDWQPPIYIYTRGRAL